MLLLSQRRGPFLEIHLLIFIFEIPSKHTNINCVVNPASVQLFDTAMFELCQRQLKLFNLGIKKTIYQKIYQDLPFILSGISTYADLSTQIG